MNTLANEAVKSQKLSSTQKKREKKKKTYSVHVHVGTFLSGTQK